MKSRLQRLCETCGGKCCRCFHAILLSGSDDPRRLEKLGAEIVDSLFGLEMVMPSDTCSFLKKGRCSIYDDRPAACQEFDCTDPRRADSAVFDDFPEHREAVTKAMRRRP